MPYLYETHLHTSTGSKCGRSRPEGYIPYYKDLGYDGIFVTDHFYRGNTQVDPNLPWPEWVKRYCQGYHEAKEAGDREGLKVFFGWESSFNGEDFLIYGLDEDWLLEHDIVKTWDPALQYEIVHAAGGLVVQAHPFRERGYMNTVHLWPHHCDAWEVMNAGNEPYQNANAYAYAKEHNMVMTAGSDIHEVASLDFAGFHQPFAMVTEKPLESAMDYVKLIQSGRGFTNNVPESFFGAETKAPYMPVVLHE